MTDSKVLKVVIGLAAGLWVSVGAPATLYVAIGLYDLSVEYHANAAVSAQWREDVGQRLVRIERKQDQGMP